MIPWSPLVRWTILIASIGMLAYIGNEIVTGVLQWQLRQELAILAEVLGAVATLGGIVLAAKLGLGVLAMTTVSTIGFLLTFLLAWRLAARAARGERRGFLPPGSPSRCSRGRAPAAAARLAHVARPPA